MPSPILKSDEAGTAPSSISPTPGLASADPGFDDAGLEAPSHVVPEIEKNDIVHSNISAPKVPSKGLEVKAKQKGFYNQHRFRENDIFFIKNWDELGEWMILTDPDLEKKHLQEIKEKKAKK